MMSRDLLLQLTSIEEMEEAADKLLMAALDGGGKDNISLVLIQDETETVPEKKDQVSPDETAGNSSDDETTSGEVNNQ